ncbi:MAG: endolytic transglycosylase MltG [bacterium]
MLTIKLLLPASLLVVFITMFYFNDFGSVNNDRTSERFIVPAGLDNDHITEKLNSENFIKSTWALNFALNWSKFNGKIQEGGYKLSRSTNTWEIAKILTKEPYLKWVTIPEGLRKEEIAEILADRLGWREENKKQWIKKDTTTKLNYFEGVYFPDTYLIPKEESTEQVAKRFQAKFEEKFTQYSKEASRQNIKWTTVIKLASIIQREAGGESDMKLISGILWNRLSKNMRLEVDCTLQYARGNTPNGWWAPIKIEDKKINSPYNTYMNSGLPPTPISNPGIKAIEAVLYPEKTNCLYYIHDNSKNIHCAETYEEHKSNIKKYL